ncbi:MAG: S41 family peptidase [Kiloniellales bacterium]
MAPLVFVLLLASCALPDGSSQGYATDRAGRLFAVGFQDVSDIYIDEVSVADLALAGLENLSTIDPAVSVSRKSNRIVLAVNGTDRAGLAAPGPQDASAWGDLAAELVSIGRQYSSRLAAASAEEVYEAVFDGLTAELDSFSRYSGREEARENRASRDGFGGIGVRISLVDEGVKVLSVMENTPAEEAGIKDEDVIVQIDGEPARGLSQHEAVRRLRGPLRSKVTLTVNRNGEPAPRDVEVVRAHIVPQTVEYKAQNDIGYMRVTGFNQSTAWTLRKKIELAEKEMGERLKGYILDLRSNPGGLLDQSVVVSDIFLQSGRIVSTHGRHPDSHQYFDADSDDLANGRPIVVLVNGNSASASEIVAAALQDSGRAVVIGSNSFGKGTVQTVLRLPNEGELTLTWARFHAPTGYGLHRRGVVPDICTSRDVTSVADVEARLRAGTLPFDKVLRRSDIAPDDDKALEALRDRCPVSEGEKEIDMEIAIDLLTNPALYSIALRGVPNTASTGAEQFSTMGQAGSAAQ